MKRQRGTACSLDGGRPDSRVPGIERRRHQHFGAYSRHLLKTFFFLFALFLTSFLFALFSPCMFSLFSQESVKTDAVGVNLRRLRVRFASYLKEAKSGESRGRVWQEFNAGKSSFSVQPIRGCRVWGGIDLVTVAQEKGCPTDLILPFFIYIYICHQLGRKDMPSYTL